MAEQAAGSEATGPTAPDNGAMTLLDAYLSCLVHDLKKVLLAHWDQGEGSRFVRYGAWGRAHRLLGDLSTQCDLAAQSLPSALALHLAEEGNDRMLRLAALHHNEESGDKPIKRSDLDPVAIYAIQAADKAHKQLYFPREPRQGSRANKPDISVGLRFPCFYPFYGTPAYWLPENTLPAAYPARVPEGVRTPNSTLHFRRLAEALQALVDSPEGLTPLSALELLGMHCADFPESPYLPVTSLAFHQRLAGALFLMFHEVLQEVAIEEHPIPVSLNLGLTTITTPPEKLRNRLRDVRNVRKTSHRLLDAVHATLRQCHLNAVDPKLFRHPGANPFLFYTKDALVLLHAEQDLPALREACQSVAEECESGFALSTELVKLQARLRLRGWEQTGDPRQGKRLSELDPADTQPGRNRLPLWFEDVPELATVTEQITPLCTFSRDDEQACFTCGKPGAFSNVDHGDRLCPTCYGFRKGYWFCSTCCTYTASATCPFCGDATASPPSPALLRQGDDRPGNRVAYVMIATSCLPEPGSLRTEVEANLACFRVDRRDFERPLLANDRERWEEFLDALAETRSTRFCLYEYLQASLDMARFQEDLEDALSDCLPWGDLPAKASPDEREQRRREALESYFLYRSPSLTVVLVDERKLARFWQGDAKRGKPGVADLLKLLNVSWAAKAVTCSVHFPVWAVLREFLADVDFLAAASGGRTGAERESPAQIAGRVREAARTWYCRADEDAAKRPDTVDAGVDLLKGCQQQWKDVYEAHSRLVVLRGNVKRSFPLEVGEYLLKAGAEVPPSRPPLAQLGELSEIAEEVCRTAADRDTALESLKLELDSRALSGREKIPRTTVKELLEQWRSLPDMTEASGLVRELATQLRSAPKPPGENTQSRPGRPRKERKEPTRVHR